MNSQKIPVPAGRYHCLFAVVLLAIHAWSTVPRLQAQTPGSSTPLASVAVKDGMLVPHDPLVAVGVEDASLHSVASGNEDRVVAVGDRGAILLSESSGRSWDIVKSGTTAGLHGVVFLSSESVVVVGGWIGNYTRASHGIILRSQDGGRHWEALPSARLPRLLGVKVHGTRLLAWGDYSPHWQSSVFESADGGFTWRGVSLSIGHATSASYAVNGNIGAVDILGRAAFVDTQFPGINIADPSRPLTFLHHTGSYWLACGDGGELIASSDSRVWRNVAIPLSPQARQLCSWLSVGQFGDTVWICGMPGSILLFSSDRGATWSVRKTGQSLPLSSIHFVDQHRGWATGPMGLVLATRDGGNTWYSQRQRASRLGVLAVAVETADCPWGPLAAAVWDQQVASAALGYRPADPIEQSNFLPRIDAVHDDIAPQLGLADYKSCTHVSPVSPEFVAHLAVDILAWRPDVVLASQARDSLSHTNNSASSSLVGHALNAIRLCALPDASLEQELDLKRWSVSKIVESCDVESSQFSEQSARVLRGPSITIRDCLAALPPSDRQRADSTSMRTSWSQSQNAAATTSLLGAIAPSQETQRKLELNGIGNVQLLLGRVHRERTMDKLEAANPETISTEQWASDLDFVLNTIPSREVPTVLIDLANRMSVISKWDLRKVVCEKIIAVVPQSDAADWARLSMLTLETSMELEVWKKMHLKQQSGGLQIADEAGKPVPIPEDRNGLRTAIAEPSSATPFGKPMAIQTLPASDSMVVPASAIVRNIVSADVNVGQLSSWQRLLNQTSRSAPELLSRPDMMLRIVRSQREATAINLVEQSIATKDFLAQVNGMTEMIGWPQMAIQEVAMLTHQTERLRWKAGAARAEKPPKLDGELNESFWLNDGHMELESFSASDANVARNAALRWAFDSQYLYIGVSCPHSKDSQSYRMADRREYDADLTGVDHVQITIDTDRDYCTAIDMAVSADGRTFDRCCGLAEYNPKWHVFVKSSDLGWTAEVAIELDSLTLDSQLDGKAWAVSARRFDPHGETQSWSQLRSHSRFLQASGLLLFAPQP